MKELIFDDGVQEIPVNGRAVLRLNPNDPNLYLRFKNAVNDIRRMESELDQKREETMDNLEILDLLGEYDQKVKVMLCQVFGQENDFDQIFGGRSVMGLARNGELAITNFFNALMPVFDEAAKTYARAEADKELAAAKADLL